MQEFDTTKYTIERNENGSLSRVDGLGGRTPEMTVDYYNSQIAYHEQVVANLEAQKAKVEEFEADNPIEEPEAEVEESEEGDPIEEPEAEVQ